MGVLGRFYYENGCFGVDFTMKIVFRVNFTIKSGVLVGKCVKMDVFSYKICQKWAVLYIKSVVF
jgi:hypothetical protein